MQIKYEALIELAQQPEGQMVRSRETLILIASMQWLCLCVDEEDELM